MLSAMGTAGTTTSYSGTRVEIMSWWSSSLLVNVAIVPFSRHNTLYQIFLFYVRYNTEGNPVEVRLLDLQLVRQASLAIDLNFFLYTSLDGPTRRSNMTCFLDTYYDCFKSVIESAQRDMPFTRAAFKQEFIDKHMYGFLFAIFIIPLSVCNSDQLPKGLTDSFGKKQENLMLEMLDSNPLFKPRFLALFDEMMEDGIVSYNIP